MGINKLVVLIKENRKKIAIWFIGGLFLGITANLISTLLLKINLLEIAFNYSWNFFVWAPIIPMWFWMITYGLIIYLLFKNKKPKTSKEIVPEYAKNYTSEIIKNIKWRFTYDSNYSYALTINPHCIECGTMLKYPENKYWGDTRFYCDTCDKKYETNYVDRADNIAMAGRIINPKIIDLREAEMKKNK